MSQSLWLADHAPSAPTSPAGDTPADVLVIGGGITGITAAWVLARGGRRVRVIDAGRIAHGETGHTTAHLTEEVDEGFSRIRKEQGAEEARLVAQTGTDAIAFIERLVGELGIDCGFERLPAYVYTQSEKGLEDLKEEADAALEAGLAAEIVSEVPVRFTVLGAMRIDRQAQFHPTRYLSALVERLRSMGVEFSEETKVLSVEDGEPARVVTERGTMTARDVLVTANVPVNQRGILQTKLPAFRTYAIAAKTSDFPAALIWDDEDPYHYVRSHRTASGLWIIIGGEDHRTGDERETDERYAALEAWARPRFDMGPVEHRWSGQIIEPPDGLPYIGRNTLSEHVWVAAGYSGQGMTMGTFAGMMLGDLVEGRPSRWSDLYSPRRLPSMGSVKEYVKDNLEFPKRLVLDRLTDYDVEGATPAELAPGEGRIVEIEGKKVAAGRLDSGELCLLSPVCPHLGCDVQWNVAEKSWDCPCHGSRFTAEGRVVNGPASDNLRPLG